MNDRKLEHLQICLQNQVDKKDAGFERIKLIHRALPEVDFNEIDTSCDFLGKKLSMPFIIGSMTGGGDNSLHIINQKLSCVAERYKIALAVGSQRIAFKNRDAEGSFNNLREFAPNTVLISNLGAVQLNNDFDLLECEKAVKMLNADALYLHLNPLQEMVQPEGNRNFGNLAEKIKKISKDLSVPLLLKEVGCGMSKKDIELLQNEKIAYFDLAGFGGTSWAFIEQLRKETKGNFNLGFTFQNWGISTVDALLATKELQKKVNFIASGGIRNGLDLAKSLILGAKAGSSTLPFLHPAVSQSERELGLVVEKMQLELKTTMFLLGVKNIKELCGNKDLILKIEEM